MRTAARILSTCGERPACGEPIARRPPPPRSGGGRREGGGRKRRAARGARATVSSAHARRAGDRREETSARATRSWAGMGPRQHALSISPRADNISLWGLARHPALNSNCTKMAFIGQPEGGGGTGGRPGSGRQGSAAGDGRGVPLLPRQCLPISTSAHRRCPYHGIHTYLPGRRTALPCSHYFTRCLPHYLPPHPHLHHPHHLYLVHHCRTHLPATCHGHAHRHLPCLPLKHALHTQALATTVSPYPSNLVWVHSSGRQGEYGHAWEEWLGDPRQTIDDCILAWRGAAVRRRAGSIPALTGETQHMPRRRNRLCLLASYLPGETPGVRRQKKGAGAN